MLCNYYSGSCGYWQWVCACGNDVVSEVDDDVDDDDDDGDDDDDDDGDDDGDVR